MRVPGASWGRDPLLWTGLLLLALVLGMPLTEPLFARLFPQLARPLYGLDSFLDLTLDHLLLVGASSGAAILLGVGAGLAATRPAGAEFRPMIDTIVTAGQTFPPVAVLAIAVPVIGFGFEPALIALLLYGLLPIVEATIAGIGAVPDSVRDAARGIGMSEGAILFRVELPLAAPVIIGGVRTSVTINLGTAAIASTAGANTLGMPIIIGLDTANPAYILQGATIIALLAVVVDLGFARLLSWITRWRAV